MLIDQRFNIQKTFMVFVIKKNGQDILQIE